MTKSKCFGRARCWRALCCASLLAVAGSAAGPAVAADDTSLDDGAKKAGNNFGELLKGMGQELKKAGGSLTDSGKQEKNKKDKKRPEQEPDKGKDNTK